MMTKNLLIYKTSTTHMKEKEKALIGASIFLTLAVAIGTWIRKL
jgi:hypothetical protein